MAASTGLVRRLVEVGRFDGADGVDWPILWLVTRSVTVMVLGAALVLAVLHAFVETYGRALLGQAETD